MMLPALEQAPTRSLSVAADAPISAVGVCSSALAEPEGVDERSSPASSRDASEATSGCASAPSGSASAAHVPSEPQSSLQTSRGFLTAGANDLAPRSVRSGVAALDSSKLRSIVSSARQSHGPRRVRWSPRERLAWQELVVVRGEGA